MRFKDILVHMASPVESSPALAAAVALAHRHDAHVTGLHVYELASELMGITGYMDAGTIERILQEAEQAALAEAARVKPVFEKTLRREAIPGEWRQVEGNIGAVLEQHARYADLTIFARTAADDFEADMAEAVLFGSGRPVLVMPPVLSRPFSPDHVIIGWNGQREAARAVADALPFLCHAKAVQVLTIATEAEETEASELDAEDLSRHLARHGVNVSAKTVTARGAAPEDLLLNAASDAGADLLVVGGYGHGRFREFVLGGVTRSLMRHATLPVMLSH